MGWFESAFPVLEVYNGHMLSSVNGAAAALVESEGRIGIGGSDAHTLLSAGSAFTEVARARSRAEFIEGIRQNRARVGGQQGNYWKLTRDLFWIGLQSIRHCPPALLLSPLLLAVPAGSLINYMVELRFARRWSRYLEARRGTPEPVTLPTSSVDGEEMAA
jgi:PHP domain-containing protein